MFVLSIGFLVGIVFGFAVEKSKVFEPAIMVGQLLFKRFTMLKVFMSAMLTSAIVLYGLYQLGYFEFRLNSLNLPQTIFGGSLLGVGIALTGACPGMMFAQLGAGYRDAWFTVAGAFMGTALFWGNSDTIHHYFEPFVMESQQLHHLLALPLWIVYGVLMATFLMILWGLEKFRSWKKDLENQGN